MRRGVGIGGIGGELQATEQVGGAERVAARSYRGGFIRRGLRRTGRVRWRVGTGVTRGRQGAFKSILLVANCFAPLFYVCSHSLAFKTLGKVAAKHEGQPLFFSVLDAGTFKAFSSDLGVMQSDLPVVVALSAKHKRFSGGNHGLSSTRTVGS